MEKISEYVWKTKIPVKIVLKKEEAASDSEVDPIWIMIPRLHYIRLYYDKIHAFFKDHISELFGKKDMWLSYDNKPVEWNMPFGVFFDLNVDDCGNRKVITLILSYRNKPEKLKNLFDYKEEEMYFFDLKQASCIRSKKQEAKNVLSYMPKDNRDLMWKKFVEENRVEFYQLFNTLWEKTSEHDKLQMPTRIYMKDFEGRIQRKVEVDPSKSRTIRDLLNDLFPSIFENGKLAGKYQDLKVIWNGTVLQLSTPLTFAMENLLYMDSFAYFVIKY